MVVTAHIFARGSIGTPVWRRTRKTKNICACLFLFFGLCCLKRGKKQKKQKKQLLLRMCACSECEFERSFGPPIFLEGQNTKLLSLLFECAKKTRKKIVTHLFHFSLNNCNRTVSVTKKGLKTPFTQASSVTQQDKSAFSSFFTFNPRLFSRTMRHLARCR